MSSFFRSGSTGDKMYLFVRDSNDENAVLAREFIEAMYRECAAFVDQEIARQVLANGLASAFWELYLAYSLKSAGISLVKRSGRVPNSDEGPDLLAAGPAVWIEAIAARCGDGPDRLNRATPGEVYSVPGDAFVLRLRNALEKKAVKFRHYGNAKWFQAGAATVIGVSGALLEFRYQQGPTPPIVRAALGVGNPVIEIDLDTGEVASRCLENCDKIVKTQGGAVDTTPFFHDDYQHVSAVLYSPSCWVSHPAVPGSDLILVHNPRASAPLPRGWLGVGDEYWVDGADLCLKRH